MAKQRKKKVESPAESSTEDLGNVSTFHVEFTRLELAHLRDLFSIKIPPELTTTLSQALADGQERILVETRLWEKLTKTFKKSGIPLEDNAPDFTILPTGPVPVGVFQIEANDAQLAATGFNTSVNEDEDE